LGIFRSPSFKPKLGKFQANFEQKNLPGGQPFSNGHLDVLFGPGIQPWLTVVERAIAQCKADFSTTMDPATGLGACLSQGSQQHFPVLFILKDSFTATASGH